MSCVPLFQQLPACHWGEAPVNVVGLQGVCSGNWARTFDTIDPTVIQQLAQVNADADTACRELTTKV